VEAGGLENLKYEFAAKTGRFTIQVSVVATLRRGSGHTTKIFAIPPARARCA
jgi:hypothetical protein